jgi:hypothetical protein
MTRPTLSLAAAFCVAVLGGCGSGEIVVTAQLAGQDSIGGVAPLKDVVVQAVPYDRDSIFDALKASYSRPEPQVPDSLIRLQQEIAQAADQEQAATQRWNIARDSLKNISDRLKGLNTSSAQYRVLYRDFAPVDAMERQAKRDMDAAFSRFKTLQERYTSQASAVKAEREQWANEAYASVDSVIALKLEAIGLAEASDTTDANGVARMPVKPGQWWVVAWYDLPYEELYWNGPIEVGRGDPTRIELTQQNAVSRPKF